MAPPPPVTILDLRTPASSGTSTPTLSLQSQIAQSLDDGQPTRGDQLFPYTRSIPTMALYSDKGLAIYEEITKLDAYYPFKAELEILTKYGDEIAARMFGLPSKVLTTSYLHQEQGSVPPPNGDHVHDHVHDHSNGASASAPVPKEKWGDEKVGQNNNGVNGESLGGLVGTAVELGSGSLEKSRVLLRALARLLRVEKGGEKGGKVFERIEYKALDLERSCLVETLSDLLEQETTCVTSVPDDTFRVVASGIAASYDEGLAHLHSSPSSPPSSLTPKSLLWLGSSMGNFSRLGAAEFLKNIAENVLEEGDSILIGLDNCSEGKMIEEAYDDKEGVTRRFIMRGLEHAGEVLGGASLKEDEFEYVSRWNEKIGRHEAYLRCKVDQLVVPLPEYDSNPSHSITLKKDELIHIEVSYKFTDLEARQIFTAAGLRLVQQWSDSRRLHTIYLLERTPFCFGNVNPRFRLTEEEEEMKKVEMEKEKEEGGGGGNSYGLPGLEEWETSWKCWDAVTLQLLPRDLLRQRPIPLRHIPLFYLGHIPAFIDIHLSRYLSEPLTEPTSFASLFERGIDPDVEKPDEINHWHSKVPEKLDEWPEVAEILDYQAKVRQRVREVYRRFEGRWERRLVRTLAMLLEHEMMHNETLLYISLQASSQLLPIPGFRAPDFPSLSRSWDRLIKSESIARSATLSFPRTTITLGHDDNDNVDDEKVPYDPAHEFGWDVEHPKREVQVEPFRIDVVPVTNGEYLHYLQTLHNLELAEKVFPATWVATKEGEGMFVAKEIRIKTLVGEIDFAYAKHWPVCASARQLELFAKAKGGRLPTHAELAVFFAQNPVDSPAGNIGFANLHAVPPTLPHLQRDGTMGGASDGGVWMWTSTLLEKWEGYSSSTVYPGYSSDFHDGKHQIIVGASYVTPPRIARSSFVNWYDNRYPFVWAGARVAYDGVKTNAKAQAS